MRPLRKLAFLLEEFQSGSPGQQLLDRFLAGYPVDGMLHRPKLETVNVYLMMSASEPDFDRRPNDFGLTVAPTAEAAVEGTDAIVVASRKPGAIANERFLEIALSRAPEEAACFIYGALANSHQRAREWVAQARARRISLLAGTSLPLTWRLPEVSAPGGMPLKRALVVVQGAFPGAELHGLECLLPFVEQRRGGENGVRGLRFLEGREVWRAGEKGLWSHALLAAALSRSDSPQGDPVVDGRTQDIWGLGLVPKLAKSPRAWLLEHSDGLISTILVLDGAVTDFNLAVESSDGAITSTQIFRAPPPAEHQYSRLAEALERFFVTGQPPWGVNRNVLIAGLLESMAKPAARLRGRLSTPELIGNR